MLLERSLVSAFTLDDLRDQLTKLGGWTWTCSESDFIGSHLVGRHTSGIRCDMIPNTTGYDVSVEGDDLPKLEVAMQSVIDAIHTD